MRNSLLLKQGFTIRKTGLQYIVLILLMVFVLKANAVDRYSVATGTWASTSTWSDTPGGTSGATVPIAGDNVYIEGGFTVTVGATAACANLSVLASSTLSVGAFAITVSGSTTVGGATAGTLTISSATGAKSFTGLLTINANGTWNNSGNSPITFKGGIANSGTFTVGTGVQSFTTNSQAISGVTSIPSLTITSITLTSNSNLTVNTAFITDATGVLDMSTNVLAGTLTTLTNGGKVKTACPSSTSTTPLTTGKTWGGTVEYTSTSGAQTIMAGTYATLTLLNTSGTNTASGSLVVNTALNTSAGGILDMTAAYTLTGTLTTITNNGTIQTAVPSVTSTTPFTTGKTFGGTGTVVYNAVAAQTLMGGTYYNLTISGSNTKTSSAAVTVDHNLTIDDGNTMSHGAYALTITGTTSIGTGVSGNLTISSSTGAKAFAGLVSIAANATWNNSGNSAITFKSGISNSGTFTVGTGIQSFTTNAQAISGITSIPSLTITSVTLTCNSNLTVNTALVTDATGVLDMTTYVLDGTLTTITSNLGKIKTACLTATSVTPVPTGKTWACTVEYSGTGSQTIVSATSYANIIISGTGSKTLAANTTVTGVCTISAGTLDLSSYTLTLSGTGTPFVVAGTFTPNTGKVLFSGATATIASTSFYNLEIQTAGAKTLGGDITVSNTCTITSGTLALSTYTLTLSGTGTPFVPTGTFTCNTGKVIYSGATANIAATTYYDLEIQTTGSKTLANNTTVTHVSTITSGTLDLSSYTLTLSGTGTPLVVSGAFTPSTGKVLYSGATATIAPSAYYNLEVQTVGAKTLGGNVSVSNICTITSGTLDISSYTLTFSGTGITPLVATGTFTSGTGKVLFSGATQTIAGVSYYDLEIQTAGVKTLGAATTVSHVCTITSGTLALSTFTLTLSGTGTPLVVSGTFTCNTGKVLYSNASATIASTSYYNLEVQTAGSKTLGGDVTVSNLCTITSGTLDISSYTLTLSGTGITPLVATGTFTSGTGKVLFSGATQTIAGVSYYDLEIQTAGVKTLGAATTVSHVCTITSGTLALSTFTLTLSGTGTPFVPTGTFTYNTGKVIYSGATATIAATSYYDLEIQTTGSKTLANNTTVTHVCTITSGTLNISSYTLTLSGTGSPLVATGTFTSSTGKVLFSGATATIAGVSYYDLEIQNAGGAKTLGANTDVSNVCTITSGSLALSTFTLTLSGNGTPLVATGTFTCNTGTVIFDGSGSQTIPALTYYNLSTATGGTKTIAGNISVGGALNIGDASTFDATSTYTVAVTGTTTVGGGTSGAFNITSGSGAKTFTGLVTVSAGATWDNSGNCPITMNGGLTNNGTFNAGTGVYTFNAASKTITGIITIPSVTISNTTSNTGTLSVSTALAGASTLTNAASATLNIGGTSTITGLTATANSNTVNFNGTGDQTIPAFDYYNLTFTNASRTITLASSGTIGVANVFTPSAATYTVTGSTISFKGSVAQDIAAFTFNNLQTATGGTKTLTGDVTVGNILTIGASSTLDLAAKTLSLTGNNTTPIVNSGTFTSSTSTVNYSGSGAQTIIGLNYYNLTVTNTARTVTLISSGTIGVAGVFSPAAATYTVTGSTVSFNGSGSQNIPVFTYNNLSTATGGTKTLAGSLTTGAVVTIGSSSTLDISSYTLTLSGSGTPLVATGTFTASTGKVLFSNATATVAGVTYYDLEIQTAGTKTLGANTTVSHVCTITSGTLSLSTFTLTLSGSGTPLVIVGTFTPSSGKVIFSNATVTVPALSYYDLEIQTAGTKTLANNTTVTHVCTITSGTLDLSSYTLTLSGTGSPLVVTGTLTPNTGKVLYSGATATIAGTTYYNLEIQTAGAKTLGADITVSNVCTITSGTLALSTFTLTLSGTGTPLVATGTFTCNSGKVIYSGATANIAAVTYYDLEIQTTGTKTLANNATTTHVCTITSGTLDLSSYTLTLSGTGTPLVISGTFTPSTGKVLYSGATANIVSTSYYNLEIQTVGAKTLVGDVTVSSVCTITSGTLDLGSYTLTLSGTGTPLVATGTFTGNTGKVLFTGATATIAGVSYYDLEIQTAGAKTLGAATTVSHVCTITSGTLALSTFTLTLSGTGSPFVVSGTFTPGTGKVLYSNATATITPTTYYNLEVQTAGSKTLGGNTTVSNICTITSGTLDLSAYTLTLSGTGTPFVVSGTFTPNTGKVLFSGATANIPATTFYNLEIQTAGSKALAGNTTVSNILTLTSGDLSIGANTLTLNGGISTASGTITGGATSNLTMGATATLPTSVSALCNFTLNAGTTTLGANLTLGSTTTGILALSGGIVNTASYYISVLYKNVNAVTGGSTTSYVEGQLRRQYGTTQAGANLYPLGKSATYLPFTLNSPTLAAAGIIGVEAFATGCGSTTYGSCVSSLSTTEYWSASLISGGGLTTSTVSLGRQDALGSLNIIARGATQSGSYASLTGTVSGTNINTSDATGNSLGFFALAVASATVPTITTPTSASVSLTSATLGGNMTAIGCTGVTERGIYYSTTNGFADGAGTKVSVSSGPYSTGVFTIGVTGLTFNTTYYYKAFATNIGGTGYSTQGSFTTTQTSYPAAENFTNDASFPTAQGSASADWGIYNNAGAGVGDNYVARLMSTNSNKWLFTPGFTATAGKIYYFDFYDKGNATDNFSISGYICSAQSSASTLSSTDYLGISKSLGNAFGTIETSTSWLCTSSGVYYWGIKGTASATANLMIDQITIHETNPATITWDGSANDGNWSTAANWDLNRTPTSSDIIVIPSTGVVGTYPTALPAGDYNDLTVKNAGSGTITVGAMSLSGNLTVASTGQAVTLSEALTVGGNVSIGASESAFTCNINGNITAGGTFTLGSASAASTYNLAAKVTSIGNFTMANNASQTLNITYSDNTTPAIVAGNSASGFTFYGAVNYNSSGSQVVMKGQYAGDMDISNSGYRYVNGNLNLDKDLNITGGTLYASSLTNSTIGASNGADENTKMEISPFRGNNRSQRWETILLASDLTGTLSTGDLIKSIAFYISSKGSVSPFSRFTVKIGNTTATNFDNGHGGDGYYIFESAPATIAYGPADYSTTAGWSIIDFSTYFKWDGSSNVLIEITWLKDDHGGDPEFDKVSYGTYAGNVNDHTWSSHGDCTEQTYGTHNTYRPTMELFYLANTANITIEKTWNNTGGTFVHRNNTVTWDGSGTEQTILTNGSNFYNATYTNSSGYILSDNCTVENTLTMTAGNYTTSANALILGTSTTNIGTLSRTTGTIIGNFKRWFASSTVSNVLFPVGTATYYRPSNITYTGAPTGGTLNVKYSTGNAGTNSVDLAIHPITDAAASITSISTDGYWSFAAANSLSGGTYTMDLTCTGISGVLDYTKLHLLKRDNSSSDWAAVGTHVAATGSNASPIIHRSGLSSFCDGIPGFGEGSLPVELLEFNVKCNGERVSISWTTSSETNNDYFTIEKSTDLKNWSIVSFVHGAGNSNAIIHYSTSDSISNSLVYYRLKQTDLDGRYEYFKSVSSDCLGRYDEFFRVYPIPSESDNINIEISTNDVDKLNIQIFNTLGQDVYQSKYETTVGLNKFKLSDLHLANGTYHLMVVTESDKVYYQNIVIK